jgi:hypothetical protein
VAVLPWVDRAYVLVKIIIPMLTEKSPLRGPVMSSLLATLCLVALLTLGVQSDANPLLTKSSLFYQLFLFEQIKDEHFVLVFEWGMVE